MKLDLKDVKPDLTNKVVMSIDPGDHIGVIVQHADGRISGLTLIGKQRNKHIWDLLNRLKPNEICYEQFSLRASAAKKMAGNKFFVCEVIGVIKLYCFENNIELNEIFPSCKEYCGFSSNPKDPKYKDIEIENNKSWNILKDMECEEKITEHVRDAYRLYTYFKLFGARFKK